MGMRLRRRGMGGRILMRPALARRSILSRNNSSSRRTAITTALRPMVSPSAVAAQEQVREQGARTRALILQSKFSIHLPPKPPTRDEDGLVWLDWFG